MANLEGHSDPTESGPAEPTPAAGPDPKAARFIALGMEFAGTVVAGVISGYYLDTWLGVAPLFTLLLTLGGMGGALYRLIWNLKKSTQADDGN